MMKSVLNARVKIVQLIRHPVPTALSLTTHHVYARNDWIKDAAIDPFDPGVVQSDLRAVWHQLTMYEKCLFWWTEIHMFGDELFHRYHDKDFFVLRYEDLFDSSSNALFDLMGFIGLPYVPKLEDLRASRTDRWVSKTAVVDVSNIRRYATTVNLAQRFGYDVDRLAQRDLRKRYFRISKLRARRA